MPNRQTITIKYYNDEASLQVWWEGYTVFRQMSMPGTPNFGDRNSQYLIFCNEIFSILGLGAEDVRFGLFSLKSERSHNEFWPKLQGKFVLAGTFFLLNTVF